MMRRSLTILRNVDPTIRSDIDALIARLEAISKEVYEREQRSK